MDGRTSKTDHRKKGDAKGSDAHTRLRSYGGDETTRRIGESIKRAARDHKRLSNYQETGIRGGRYYPVGSYGFPGSTGGPKMRGIYLFLFAGIVLSFVLTVAAIVALFYPTDISPDNTIKAIPISANAGALLSYKINGCDEGAHSGTTSVNIQSIDTPPSITVAVAAPSPQTVHCQNALLIPQPLPTGDYKIIVFIRYNVNPIRDILLPVERKYTSNIIHITNPNPDYVLPTVNAENTNQAKERAKTLENTQHVAQPEQAQTPTQLPEPAPTAPKNPGVVGGVVNTLTDVMNTLKTNLLGGK